MIISSSVALAETAAAQTLADYFLPIPVIDELTSNGWGASNVQPRDQDNGLEDKSNASWSYWDGRIVKNADGRFHLFGSRWSQGAGHNGWFGSECVHAISASNPLGPYIDQGRCYGDENGLGHNVMASQLPDGRYFILVSETRRPAIIYTSESLDGPWEKEGTITTEANGFPVDASEGSMLHSNTTLWVRDDGSILATSRDGVIMLSNNGILGPYLVQSTSVYDSSITYTPTGTPEDPCLWYSGGKYHMVYSYPLDRIAYHLTSVDGIHDWQNEGVAFRATEPFIRYEDGTVNTWNKLERPQVYLENGHVKYFTFSGIDVDKAQDGGNDSHNSKIIVVPFDGERFDAETGIDGGDSDGSGGSGGTTTGGEVTSAGGTSTGGAGGSGGVGGTVTGGTVTAGNAVTAGSTGGSVAAGGAASVTAGTVSGTLATTSTASATTVTSGVVSSTGASSAGASDVTATASNSGGLTDSGTNSASPTGGDAASDDSGCGCRVTGGRSSSSSLAWLGLLGALLLRARRRSLPS